MLGIRRKLVRAWRNPLLTPGDREVFTKLAQAHRGLYSYTQERIITACAPCASVKT